MTQLLQQALGEVQKLSAAEQDAIAALILDELSDDRQWDEAFAKSQPQLDKLAAKARADVAQGRVQEQGFDDL
jgi:hypothetical protein